MSYSAFCLRLILPILCLLCIPACSTPTTSPTATTPTAAAPAKLHCQCLVCKHNGDLACVDVELTPATPRTVYQSQTYYFCSDECKAEFEKHPDKYVAEAHKP